ncbi:hypothetical protein Tco_1378029 [Tanacetum coccineum]
MNRDPSGSPTFRTRLTTDGVVTGLTVTNVAVFLLLKVADNRFMIGHQFGPEFVLMLYMARAAVCSAFYVVHHAFLVPSSKQSLFSLASLKEWKSAVFYAVTSENEFQVIKIEAEKVYVYIKVVTFSITDAAVLTHLSLNGVSLVEDDIIEALQRGFKKEQVWTGLNYVSESGGVSERRGKEVMMAMSEESIGGGKWLGVVGAF